jgi:hypothetical protein
MTSRCWAGAVLLSAATAFALLAVGCGPSDKQAGTNPDTARAGQAEAKNDHSDWWCAEHGIPEKECSMCDEEVAKACKAKGDWCEKHNRARSQCFVCDPSLKEKYAARYRAKYGKEPPPITEKAEDPAKKD